MGLLMVLFAALPLHASAQTASAVGGRVSDPSGEPITGVLVTVTGMQPVLTGGRGIFVVHGVAPGERVLTLEHLAYGTHSQIVVVSAGQELALEVTMSPQAIELAPLVVETVSELEERRVSTGHGISEVTALQIDRAATEGLTLTELLASHVPGVQVSRSLTGATCVRYRSVRADNRPGCNTLTVVLDGVPLSNPSFLDGTIRLADLERVEMLSPGQAGMRYGTLGGQSVLVIETKRGPVARTSELDRLVGPFDWTGEPEPYPWLKVLGSAFVANAVGVGVGLALADHCFWTPEEASMFALRTRCRGAGTFAAGVVSVGLPALGGSIVTRRYGRTSRSHGRVMPSAVTAGIILTGGYLMMIESEGAGRTAGTIVLAVAAPLALTVADRVFRILR
jgi:hypothetical protein